MDGSVSLPAVPTPGIYLTAQACGRRYGISWRTWRRLVDGGKAPQPVRFGRCVRWPKLALLQWEKTGCRPVRTLTTKGPRP